ncbi:hypothetical protein I1A62_10055 [Rhodococcus sp. USK10]|nr:MULTISPECIES: hypothetical protein [Rhodococcus]QYB04763.1 hypothetical protein I1A62_10055 [Rhodococcus sp. USK10]
MELEVWGEFDEEIGGAPAGGNSAGETAFTDLPEFIPFAGLDGNLLFIDTHCNAVRSCRLP